MLEAMKSSTLSFLDLPVDQHALLGPQLNTEVAEHALSGLPLNTDVAEQAFSWMPTTADVPVTTDQPASGSDSGILPADPVVLSHGGGVNLKGEPIRRMSASLRPTDTPPEIWNKLKGEQREIYLASYNASAAIQSIVSDAMSFKQSLDQKAIDSVKHSCPLFLECVCR